MDAPPGLAPESRRTFEEMDRLGLFEAKGETPEQMRRNSAAQWPLRGDGPAVAAVEECEIEGGAGSVPLRIYRTEGDSERAILWLHGGGWVVGDLDQADANCRRLCVDTASLVVSVGYRLAPEHPFPAGLEDSFAAAAWLAGELGATLPAVPLAVGGDSAGGNLAAALCLLARERGGPAIDHQLLIYPVACDYFETGSYREFGEDYVLTRQMMIVFWEHYLGAEVGEAPELAAVLRATNLSGLPPATFVIAGCDVLRDEAEEYAARLEAVGVPVRVLRHPGQLHGFWTYGAHTELPRQINFEVRKSFLATRI